MPEDNAPDMKIETETETETEAETQIPSTADTVEQKSSRFKDILVEWFNTHMNNSPVARNGEAYQHVRDSLQPLEDLLNKYIQ